MGCQQRCSQHSAHCVVLSPRHSRWGRAHSAPFQLLRNRGAAQHWHFPGSHGLALLGPVTAWSLPGGELCHGIVSLLLVFHIITSWTKEKNYVSQRTSRSQNEDTSRKIRHLVARGFLHFHLLPGEEWVCFPSRAPSSSKAFGFGNSLTLSLYLSLSLFCCRLFHLLYYPYSQLECIISCHLAFRYRS